MWLSLIFWSTVALLRTNQLIYSKQKKNSFNNQFVLFIEKFTLYTVYENSNKYFTNQITRYNKNGLFINLPQHYLIFNKKKKFDRELKVQQSAYFNKYLIDKYLILPQHMLQKQKFHQKHNFLVISNQLIYSIPTYKESVFLSVRNYLFS